MNYQPPTRDGPAAASTAGQVNDDADEELEGSKKPSKGLPTVRSNAAMTMRPEWGPSNGSSSGAANAALTAEVREKWRAVLARSNREMLQELAMQSAAEAAEDRGGGRATTSFGSSFSRGGPRTVDRIAQDVADRILAEVPELLEAVNFAGTREEREAMNGHSQEAKPQIQDLKSVPWSIWVGGREDGKREEKGESMSSPYGSSPPPTPQEPSQDFGVEGLFNPRCPLMRQPSGSVDALSVPPPPLPGGAAARKSRSERQTTGSGRKSAARTSMVSGLRMYSATHKHTWMAWNSRPETVMLVAKPGDPQVVAKLREIAVWLDSQGATILVQPELLWEIRDIPCPQDDIEDDDDLTRTTSQAKGRILESLKLCWCQGKCGCRRLERRQTSEDPEFKPRYKWGFRGTEDLPQGFAERCRTWTPGVDELERSVDLVVCLGGDGTLCWAAGQFRGAMPPVIAFAGGSLGFLTPFPMTEWMTALVPLLGANLRGQAMQPVQIGCRTRFQVKLIRAGAAKEDQDGSVIDSELGSVEAIQDSPQALNEVLVHRGTSSHLVKLEVLVNQKPITMVQGDGLILATPTGSTAYSLAAGGSMVHPSVPGIILTPVCPHSLSFRPVVLPDSAHVTVRVPRSARSSRATIAVDGKDTIELCRGDSIEVFVSPFPLPTICRTSETDDWFNSVNEALQWNLRREQKALNH